MFKLNIELQKHVTKRATIYFLFSRVNAITNYLLLGDQKGT